MKRPVGTIKIMKYVWILLLFTVVGMIAYRAGRADGAVSGVPGSASDPLITKSYLEERLSGIEVGAAEFVPVTLVRGEKVLLSAGGEMMIYSGNAAVEGNGGLVSLTSGELFKKGNTAVRYHLYLAPSDGCGISADGNVTVYIRGSYSKK